MRKRLRYKAQCEEVRYVNEVLEVVRKCMLKLIFRF